MNITRLAAAAALDYAFSTVDGVSQEVFAENLKLWDRKVGQVKDFFDF